MTSIITAVFKVTVGLLVNKGRDKAAERLKEGDVTDQKFRGMIVREIDDIKSKLDGLSRKDLLAALDFFEAGLRYLYKAVDAKNTDEPSAVNLGAVGEISPSPDAAVKTVSLASEMGNMQLTELDGKSKAVLFQAKERFKMAREKATEASNNEALSTFDRITAIRYRVMATMLESAAETMATASDLSLSVESALENALPECEQCLKKLHSLPAVQNSFKVEFQTGLNLRGRFGKEERMEIISTICQVNRAIYDATQTVNKPVNVWVWPFVDTGEDKVDPLRDGRVAKVLRKVAMEFCCIIPCGSFGQEGEKEQKLKSPVGIATNSRGQFLIADDGDKTIKVFDSNGNFHLSFNLQTDDSSAELYDILDVASDEKDSIYVLIGLKKPGGNEYELEVWIFDRATTLLRKFPMKKGPWGQGRRLTVCGSKVLVLRGSGSGDVVDVYKLDGGFIRSFGGGLLKNARDITSANAPVMVMDTGDSSVHLFTMKGKQESKMNVNIEGDHNYSVAFHPAGAHFVVAGYERGTECPSMAVYTVNGKFLRRIQFGEENTNWLGGITVTREGHIAVIIREEGKVSLIVN